MQTLEMAVAELISSGVISYEQGVAISLYPDEVTRATQLARGGQPNASVAAS